MHTPLLLVLRLIPVTVGGKSKPCPDWDSPLFLSEFYLGFLKRVKKTGISKTIVMAEGRVVCRILQSHAHRQPLSLFSEDVKRGCL